ncbi:DUF4442 domain-containing protein [Corynebacterium sp. TAE3-ERU12]|uniref:hotdog fold domain-containing protein n=1 Tax=Corynebacterium sp. TAE3-ERU12 TaxID=2849491 RepID=UPI001C45525D|nr:hotdog fold domain-containing protein [Corynebacterium sp. TAE3-ERU12]MBV7294778.1 DUF4442 domain-containing protein [Corynebacterium sp. TAE3-ERU12]
MTHALDKPTGTLKGWQKVSKVPLVGTRIFSFGTCLIAPYFGTVLPHVREMEPGRAVVTAPKWWGVQNHIHTFHAIAGCNVAEVAMGMLCEASVPTTHRWVPKAMDVRYVTISQGGLTAVATADLPNFDEITVESGGQDLPVTIELRDKRDTVVQKVTITTWITAKKPKQK